MSSGAFLPVGAQHGTISSGALSTAQLSYVVRPFMALSATVGWARSRDLTTADDSALDLFSYDIGSEVRTRDLQMSDRITLRSFVGGGIGVRSYDSRQNGRTSLHALAAYGSFGGELGAGRVRLRLDARDYVTHSKPLGSRGESETRSELALTAGVRLVSR